MDLVRRQSTASPASSPKSSASSNHPQLSSVALVSAINSTTTARMSTSWIWIIEQEALEVGVAELSCSGMEQKY